MRKLHVFRKHKIKKPFAQVHQTLTGIGFRQKRSEGHIVYQLNFYDAVTTSNYLLHLPTKTNEKGITTVLLKEARYHGDAGVPETVQRVMDRVLEEMIHDLKTTVVKTQKSLEEANNSSMAQDEQEVKRLGKEMRKMKTNSELKRDGMVPDPKQ